MDDQYHWYHHQILGETSKLFFIQLVENPSREAEKRNVTAESRALLAAGRDEVANVVRSCDDLVRYCSKFSPEFSVDCFTNDVIKILKLADGVPPEVELSLFIKSDFHTNARRDC